MSRTLLAEKLEQLEGDGHVGQRESDLNLLLQEVHLVIVDYVEAEIRFEDLAHLLQVDLQTEASTESTEYSCHVDIVYLYIYISDYETLVY